MSNPTPADMPGRTPNRCRPKITRGDVWHVSSNELQPCLGAELWADRPAIIVSNDLMSNRSGVVQVVYLSSSTNKRTSPVHVPISPVSGRTATMALCEQVHSVDTSRLGRRIGAVTKQELAEISQAIALNLQLSTDVRQATLFKKWEAHVKRYGIDMAAEIEALGAHTTDQRVERLLETCIALAKERDAFRQLAECANQVPALLGLTREALLQE